MSITACFFPLLCYLNRVASNFLIMYISSYIIVRYLKNMNSEWNDKSVSEVLALQAGGTQVCEPA